MKDITKYRNISVTHKVYNDLIAISKAQIPGVKLSVSKTVETLATKEKKRLNGKLSGKKHELSIECTDATYGGLERDRLV